MEIQQVLNFAYLYYIFEDILMEYCGELRKGNLFCMSLQDADGIIPSLIRAQANMALKRVHGNEWRYAALNFTSLHKYGSLEFRAFRSTKNFKEIEKWVELLLRIKDSSLKYDKPYEMMEAVSVEGMEGFMEGVFGRHVLDLACDGWQDMLMDGARRIQVLCYTEVKKKRKRNDIDMLLYDLANEQKEPDEEIEF
jgi:hypothetical protein